MALDLSSYLCMAMSNRTVSPPAAIIQPVTSNTVFTILGSDAGAYIFHAYEADDLTVHTIIGIYPFSDAR